MKIAWEELLLGASALSFLAIASLRDWRTRALDLALAAAFALWGLVAGFFFRPGGLGDLLLSLLPGLCMALFSLASRGAIGLGDAIAALVLGLYLSFDELLALLFGAFFLSALYGGFIFIKRRRGGERFAFIPFLLLAYLACIFGRLLC